MVDTRKDTRRQANKMIALGFGSELLLGVIIAVITTLIGSISSTVIIEMGELLGASAILALILAIFMATLVYRKEPNIVIAIILALFYTALGAFASVATALIISALMHPLTW
ncbi:MAG TPA: hypothetical protein VFQ70_04405 [Candidatus Saccharimonadaceae bacterium]|nr:hypothetical protein [Candidatus Saccharimonadaceae bacterium]